jgi:hypothetical protein
MIEYALTIRVMNGRTAEDFRGGKCESDPYVKVSDTGLAQKKDPNSSWGVTADDPRRVFPSLEENEDLNLATLSGRQELSEQIGPFTLVIRSQHDWHDGPRIIHECSVERE